MKLFIAEKSGMARQ